MKYKFSMFKHYLPKYIKGATENIGERLQY